MSSSKVIVLGAGIGGMATAARLARMGRSVTIYEAAEVSGGIFRTIWIDGFAFDIGPTLLTLPAIYKDLFLKTGKRLEQIMELLPVSPYFHYLFADGKDVKFENLSHNKTLIAIENSLGKSAANSYHQIISHAEKMWDEQRTTFSSQNNREYTVRRSLRSFLRKYNKSPYIAQIFNYYAIAVGKTPKQASASLITIPFVLETFGSWHVKGGIGNLTKSLEQRCRDLGVEFFFNTPVIGILQNSGSVSGIRTANGDAIECKTVVAETGTNFGRFTILLGLRKDEHAKKINHHTLIFSDEKSFDGLEIDSAIHICYPNDSTMVSDAGSENWVVSVYATEHGQSSVFNWSEAEFKERYADQIIAILERNGFSIRDRILVMEILNLTAQPFATLNLINHEPPLAGLYCVTDIAHPASGQPLVALSAENVAEAIGRA